MRGDLKPEKTDHITISIDKGILEEVKDAARKQNASVNAVINKMIQDSVVFGQYFKDHLPMMIAPKVFSYLLNELDEESWIKAWVLSFQLYAPPIFSMHKMDLSLDNFVHQLGDIQLKAGTFDKYTCHQDKDGNYKLVMTHQYGPKWSRILATAFSIMFKEGFGITPKTRHSQNTLTFEIIQNPSQE